MIEQRTTDWYLCRKGMFTASEMWKLMQGGTRPMNEEELLAAKESKSKRKTVDVMFGDTAITYIRNKVAESLMTTNSFIDYIDENSFATRAMQRGIELEFEARNIYSERFNKRVDEVGFEIYDEYSGGSLDGLVDGENAQIEIKCPNTDKHLMFMLMKDGKELLDVEPKYYYQVQFNLMGYKHDWCDFVSYDNRLKGKLDMSVTRIYPDTELFKEFNLRIKEAGLIKDKMINDIVNLAITN